MVETPKNQFSMRAIIMLTAAIAVWVWIFSEITPVELAVFTGVALSAGVFAHFVYSFWFPLRFTAIVTVLLTYNSILLALVLLGSSSSAPLSHYWDLLVDVLVQPVDFLMHAKTPRAILFSLTILLGTAFFTPAHAIRPSFPSALITALGIGIWYAAGILMMMYAG